MPHRRRCYKSNRAVQKALGDKNGRRLTILEAKDFSRPSYYFRTTPISGAKQSTHLSLTAALSLAEQLRLRAFSSASQSPP